MLMVIDFILSAGIVLGGDAIGGQDGAILAILCLILFDVICIRWDVRK